MVLKIPSRRCQVKPGCEEEPGKGRRRSPTTSPMWRSRRRECGRAPDGGLTSEIPMVVAACGHPKVSHGSICTPRC